jgi:RimJ/RimL family protein N-acetyltransferase
MSIPEIALVKVTRTHKRAMQTGMAQLAAMLQLSLPEKWPQFPEAFACSENLLQDDAAENSAWPGYFFICPATRCLVGNGGFAGTLDANGAIEIGYEIAPQFQNRGFATAAVRALLELAFAQPEVNAVVAHTLAQVNASNAVLKKVGMRFVAELPNDEVGLVWRWQLDRHD